MGLSEYKRKRAFDRTPEPAPSTPATDDHVFVVQKHDATSLHYDLRLRVKDVLKSWAVPKGPSLDSKEKRLAIEVEDHPVSYATFEGTIPEGQYGGGTVMVWDTGTWAPVGDPIASLERGELKFHLEGQRLKGKWVLVRTKRPAKQPQWLLIKERDTEASPGVHAETFATSVLTGRTMDEIADGAPPHKLPVAARAPRAQDVPGARKASMPARIKPQLATPAESAPEGDNWIHEVKFDGYRLLIFRKHDSVKILSRSGLDWTSKLPDIAGAARDKLRVDAVLDGEAVILDSRGVSDFQALQNAIHNRRSTSLVFLAFDLPWCDGFDLTKSPLEHRRSLLESLLGRRQEGRLRFSQHVEGNGPAAYAHVCAGGLEGIVSKKKGSPYTQARTPAWIKVKCFNQQEFVVVGHTAPEGAREQFGALLLAYYEEGTLRFAGKVGTGFSTETLRKLAAQLRPLAVKAPPVVNPPTGAEARDVTWVRPELVAQVQFREWTGDGVIRHTSFRGLRDDLDPATVIREPISAPTNPPPTPSTESPVNPKKTTKKKTTRKTTKAEATTKVAKAKSSKAAKDETAKVVKTKVVKTKVAKTKVAKTKTAAEGKPAKPAIPAPIAEPQAVPRITSAERVVYPDRGGGYSITKGQLAEYYTTVAPLVLPHIANRPLAVLRCPSGEGGKSFFQKHPAKGMPAAIDSVEVPGDDEKHLLIHDQAGLLGLVQMSVLEFHPWGCPAASINNPDRLVFDLDPGSGVTWRQMVEGAVMVRDALEQTKLKGFARTSGGKGIHIVVPLRPGHTWEEAKAFCKAAADVLVKLAPRRFVATPGASNREGRIFIDYLRNTRGATAIAPYSTRARPGAPVALPVSWDELPGLESASAFNVLSVARRIASGAPDPWRTMPASAGALPRRA